MSLSLRRRTWMYLMYGITFQPVFETANLGRTIFYFAPQLTSFRTQKLRCHTTLIPSYPTVRMARLSHIHNAAGSASSLALIAQFVAPLLRLLFSWRYMVLLLVLLYLFRDFSLNLCWTWLFCVSWCELVMHVHLVLFLHLSRWESKIMRLGKIIMLSYFCTYPL